MIEELIRIENGIFVNAGREYHFDIMLSKGEGVGIYVDNHRTSGTAFREIFSEKTRIESGRVFLHGERTGYPEIMRWIRENTLVIDRNRFQAKELTARDYVCAFDKKVRRIRLRAQARKLLTKEAEEVRQQMGIFFDWSTPLTALAMPDYYRLSAFKAWLSRSQVIVLDRITEILRRQDLEPFMDCIRLLMEHGTAVFLMDLDEAFLFCYADHIDIFKNRHYCYRLDPEEYGTRLYDILGWMPDRRSGLKKSDFYFDTDSAQSSATDTADTAAAASDRSFSVVVPKDRTPVLTVSNLTFRGLAPIDFSLAGGEIGLLQDENYRTGVCIRECFLDGRNWEYGTFLLNGLPLSCRELRDLVGTKIAVQIAMPDRTGGVLFDNLSALENLSTSLIPKAGKRFLHKHMMDSILDEASEWFDKDALLKPISTWSMPDRLRLTYFKWYLMNPRVLICLFPFLGQESLYHEMIIDLLVLCARRGIAVWVISSGIHAIHEKTRSREFLERVRFLD